MKHKIGLSLIFFIAAIAGCKKNALPGIDTEPRLQSYELVVEGGINTLQNDQYIRLTKPALLPNEVAQPLTSAIVNVNDGIRDIHFIETVTPGVYTAILTNSPNYDQPYTLKVEYNNKQYIAVDTLKRVRSIDPHYLPISTKLLGNGIVRLTIPKHTFGVAVPQQWLIAYQGIAPWNPKEFDFKFAFSYSHLFGSPNALYPLLQETRAINLSLNDSITVYKFSLSNNHSRFLYNVFQETDWKGLFSTQPGKITGNVSGSGEGYFYADDIKVQKFLVKDLIK